jgi:hypothetical protein
MPGPTSGRAVAAFVLAIAGWALCSGLASVPGFLLARAELAAIDRGEAPYAGRGLAHAAYWIALLNVILVGIGVVFVALMFVLGLR